MATGTGKQSPVHGDGDLAELAAAAYVVGFPLVFDLEQVQRYVTTGIGSNPAAPFNSFSHARALSGPDDHFVSLNNDTLYSMGSLDVSGGPQLLHVPDSGTRYDVFQFVDAWTNNFAYIGMRATGTGAGTYLLTPPGWTGIVPDGATRIALPTPIASIVGRWGCDGPEDLSAIAALQDQLVLEPLNPDQSLGDGLPVPDPGVGGDLLFFEKLRVWARACPPSPTIQVQLESFRPLGILDDTSPYVDPPGDLRGALVAGAAAGHQQLVDILRAGTAPKHNGWTTALHTFDYNTDYFELGTIDSPDWKIDDPRRATITRAIAALGGLWGNHGYEAAYFLTYEDLDGNALHGDHRYTLTFPTPPPCDAFWSVTMYDLPEYYMVANAIDRYSIGDRTPGLHYTADGSLTLHLQHEEPSDPAARANWLPTPADAFRPILRIYAPGQAILDATYEIPGISRID